MPANYTVIFTHPSGATATFIYEDGELSALAKGLDAEQFWLFKQVKALLLRNEEGDLELAEAVMAKAGFTAQVTRPLPDLLAPPTPVRHKAATPEEAPVPVHYRSLHTDEFLPFRRYGTSHGEVHWRESEPPPAAPPPHRAPAMTVPATTDQSPQQEVKEWSVPRVSTSHGEIHWREEH